MKKWLLKINRKLGFYGVNLLTLYLNLSGLPRYWKDLKKYKNQAKGNEVFVMAKQRPILTDSKSDAGTMKGHYFHQDLYVARKIHSANPQRHIDIGSRTDGFVAHVASFREIEIIDIRAMSSKVKNISFRQADLMELPPDLKSCTDSLSSLHAIEHFGLGRYGDPIDYFGYRKAIMNSAEILREGGTFYFAVPIGPQRVEFNAHRVFSVAYLMELFSDRYEISHFSYVNDEGDFFEEVELSDQNVANNFGCYFGCGIFVLTKI